MTKNIFLTFVASILLCACGSEDIIPSQTLGDADENTQYTFNISVEGPEESQTRAIKKSWTAGDKIFMWFDDNADAANADLVITTTDGSSWTTENFRDEVSLKESGVIKALYLSSNTWSGTLPTAVPMVLYTDGTKVTYTCKNNVVTANIGNWLYATQHQVVVTSLDTETPPETYTLACNKFKTLKEMSLKSDGITPVDGNADATATGMANTDGVAFFFSSISEGSGTLQSYTLTMNSSLEKSRRYFFSKQITSDTKKCQGLKLDAGKMYVNLSSPESANCYITPTSGKYCFNAMLKGNGSTDPAGGDSKITGATSAEVVWETHSQGRVIKCNEGQYDLQLNDGYVYFSVSDDFNPANESTNGNALIAVKDAESNILWSWHIWATKMPAEIPYSDKVVFMDRNLGAENYNTDYYKNGFMYQWGRKDPFPAGGPYDSPTPFEFYPNLYPTFGGISAQQTLAYSITNPTIFIDNSPDWSSDAQATSFWGDTKTIYDPCPPGWRIPTKTMLETSDNRTFITGSQMTINYGGSEYTLYHCNAGFGGWNGSRFSYGNANGTGYYWTSNSITSGAGAGGAYNYRPGLRLDLNPSGYSKRCHGYTVRPVKDL